MRICSWSPPYLSESGRIVSRVDAPGSGNVLVRREQFRRADRPDACASLARAFVAGKLHNARHTLLRAARDTDDPEAGIPVVGQGCDEAPSGPPETPTTPRPRPNSSARPR